MHAFISEGAPQKKMHMQTAKARQAQVGFYYHLMFKQGPHRAPFDVLSICLLELKRKISLLSFPLFSRQWDSEHCQISRTGPEPAEPCLEVKTKKRAVHYIVQLSLSIGFQNELAVKIWYQMSAVEKE